MSDAWSSPADYASAPDVATRDLETQVFSSTRIQEATYDPNTGELVVTFSRGDQRTYQGVPEQVWRDFLQAPSAGRYFGQMIARYNEGY